MRAGEIPEGFASPEWMHERISIDRDTECHIWTGKREAKPDPYGVVYRNGVSRMAHRVAWALSGRALTPGKTLDHLCRTRLCVNPDHLEEVSQRENTGRGSSPIGELIRIQASGRCNNGHDLGQVGYWRAGRSRTCAACGRERVRRYLAKKKVAS